jgi:predicted Zn-dependent protease
LFNLEISFDTKLANKRLRLSTGLLAFLFYMIIFGIMAEETLAQGDKQIIADNHKLLSARQLLIEGTECLHNNQNQQAKLKLENACAIAPDLPQVHHQLGIALAKLGDNEAAINEFSTAIKLDPNSAASLLNLAAVYQTSGNIEGAKATYQEFIGRFPEDKDASKIRALIASLEVPASAFNKITTTSKSVSANQSTDGETNSVLNKDDIKSLNSSNAKTEGDYYAEIARRGIWLWPKERLPVKVYIERAKPSNGATAQYVSILNNAFKDWAAGSGGTLDFSFVDTASKADIVCTWSKDKSKFKNSSEAANSRVYAKNGMLDKGEIEILTVSVSDSGAITDNQARATALHEVGHVIGLTGHSADPQDVMYISASLKDIWTKLSNRDVNTLVRLYSSNGR